jgi:small-conductance mechanosensitive channel
LTPLALLQSGPILADTGAWPGPLAGWEVPLSTVIRAAIVALLTLIVARRIRHWFERATARTKADANARLGVGRLLSILVLVVGGVTLLDTFGIPLSAVVTFLGVVGLAITLALQDILRNFFAGLYMLFERPFRLGDTVAVKDQRGVVETIGIRTTTLRTDENVQVLIPNMVMFAEIVLNRTEAIVRPAEPSPAGPAPAAPEPVGPASGAGRDSPGAGLAGTSNPPPSRH